MELLSALPADLAAIADPSARGAAPLRASATAEVAGSEGATPFALCLALLATPLRGGEASPLTGKDLPVEGPPPVKGSGQPPVAAASPLVLDLPTLGSVTQAGSREPELPTAAPLVSGATAVATDGTPASGPVPPLQSAASPLAGVPFEPAEAADLGPLAALAEADTEPAPLGAAPRAPPQVNPRSPEPSPWFDTTFAADERGPQPSFAAAFDWRGAAAPTRPAAATVIQSEPSTLVAGSTATSANIPEALAALRRVEPLKVSAPAADLAGVVSTDWLAPVAELRSVASAVTPPVAAAGGTAVDTRSANWHEAFASRIQWAVDQQIGEARIKLNPPELGAVDVKISLVDDQTFVQLTTATAAARDELAQSLPRLRELFTVSGLELGGASVHSGRDGQHAAPENRGGAEPAPRAFTAVAERDGEGRAPVERRSIGRIDVFA